MRRATLVGGLLLSAVAAAWVIWSVAHRRNAPDEDGAGRPAPSSGPVPGVVLICLDTLRADALALDSGRPVAMPRLEAFAHESVAFADATAPSAWTGPSITSLLTGLDPSHTGVVGLPDRIGNLSAAVKTLAERLVAAGWHTGAVTTGAWLMPGTSALRGTQVGFRDLDRDPEAVIARWAGARPVRAPFFLFLHALAAHDPYLEKTLDDDALSPTGDAVLAVDEVRARAVAAEIAGGRAPSDADMRWFAELILRSGATRARLRAVIGLGPLDALYGLLQRWLDDGAERDSELPALAQRLHAAYVESLSSVDRTVGRILDGLAAQHLPDGTVVIVVADHGESFAEHRTLLHGRRLYDELLRVPFLIHAGGRLGAPRVVRGAAGLVDVVPTVLELAGLAPASGLDGVGLVAATAAPAGLADRAMRAFDERRRFVDGAERVELLEAVRTPRAKAIVRRDAANRRIIAADVFDLGADAAEARPIPFNAFDHPCGFGDAFARALKDAGLPMPCLDK